MLGNARLNVLRVAEAKVKTFNKPENSDKGSLHFIQAKQTLPLSKQCAATARR